MDVLNLISVIGVHIDPYLSHSLICIDQVKNKYMYLYKYIKNVFKHGYVCVPNFFHATILKGFW